MTADCFCVACGYPLKHARSGNCPECGNPYSAETARSTATHPRAYLRVRWLRRIRRALILLVLASALLVSLFYALVHKDYLALRYNVWRAGGWDVVRVNWYDEEPGYTLTGVVLAAKDRPDAVVVLSLRSTEALRGDEPIRVHGMKARRLNGNDRRLLSDPRLSKKQRYELQHVTDSLDLKHTGPLGHLFPHPIRNLNDLKVHYDEVYGVFSSFPTEDER